MDPEVSRDYLASLLGEETGVLGQLEELLLREHEVLQAGDAVALNAMAPTRQERIGALARIEEQRRSLCRSHGQSADSAGLENLMMWCDPTGSLVSRLRECADRASRCRDLNDRNAILVSTRLKHVADRLEVLTGRNPQGNTYGPKGTAAPARAGRVLGAA
jgi:flagellar biosynthesis/type III secretory pathway chaperone